MIGRFLVLFGRAVTAMGRQFSVQLVQKERAIRWRQSPDNYRKLTRVMAMCVGVFFASSNYQNFFELQAAEYSTWDDVPSFSMRGGLKAFWNIRGLRSSEHTDAALARGFLPVTIQITLADYPGKQKESILEFIRERHNDPWTKPDFFEKIVKRNIELTTPDGLYVNDIEFGFERDPAKAWANPAVRTRSGAQTFAEFKTAYWREWATWFSLPSKWTKERYPGAEVGIFGPQPFYKDTWDIKSLDESRLLRYHTFDREIWRHIYPFVDFIAVEVYVPYGDPGSLFYMAMHLELNAERVKELGGKPIYAYEWLRYYRSDWSSAPMVDPYLVEAMAIMPYFSGAKGVVLWGYEPQVAPGDPLPYPQLPLFVRSLGRVAAISQKIGRGHLVVAEPAQALWKSQRPLVRQIDLPEGECIIMAINPWQSDNTAAKAEITCDGKLVSIEMIGRHTTLAVVSNGAVGLQ